MQANTAIFIDGPNVFATAKACGIEMDYKAVLEYFKRTTEVVGAAYYTAVIPRNPSENDPIRPLLDWLEYNGWTVVQKPTKEWDDGLGGRKRKGNMDIEIAVDAMELSPHMRQAVFFTGDGDFKPLLVALQRRGVTCTVISSIKTNPPMCSDELRRAANTFIPLEEFVNILAMPTARSKYG